LHDESPVVDEQSVGLVAVEAKPPLALIQEVGVVDYFESAAASSEQMLNWAMMEHNQEPAELRKALQSVELYVNIRSKIGKFIERAKEGKGSWDPWGMSEVDEEFANGMSKDRLRKTKKESREKRP